MTVSTPNGVLLKGKKNALRTASKFAERIGVAKKNCKIDEVECLKTTFDLLPMREQVFLFLLSHYV